MERSPASRGGTRGCLCLLLLVVSLAAARGSKQLQVISTHVKPSALSTNQLNTAVTDAVKALKLEEEGKEPWVPKGSSSAALHARFTKASPAAIVAGRNGLIIANASLILRDRFILTDEEAAFQLKKIKLTDMPDICPARKFCKGNDLYRTQDGSCNNLDRPNWGKAVTPLRRLLDPAYDDYLSSPRTRATNGSPLPSARLVSTTVSADVNSPREDLTLLVMQMAQFIDHDIVHTPTRQISRGYGDSSSPCCPDTNTLHIRRRRSRPIGCFPITIPSNDPFYEKTCMNFVRSMFAPSNGCNLGYADQLNQISHYLDGSGIYGSSVLEIETLRLGRFGLLKVQDQNLLPEIIKESSCDAGGNPCFLAGDVRVNEQPELTVLHTIWMREHNRVARELAQMNPSWLDEKLFQESRRIVVAELQHIVYNEWLPIILGSRFQSSTIGLPLQFGFLNSYDDGLMATIANEFATVAYRFGHSLVQGSMKLFDSSYSETDSLELHQHFFRPSTLYTSGKIEEFVRGLTTQPPQSNEQHVSKQLTNHLFQQGATLGTGFDLVALNIQRGRDHGIPPYNAMRKHCGLRTASTFKDLHGIPSQVQQDFSNVYNSVEDIDAFIGGISETHDPDSLLGPTFRCIISDQFRRLKFGDRFFYENGGLDTSFTKSQLIAIRHTSLARVLCDNSNIKEIQPLALRKVSSSNKRKHCFKDPAIPIVKLGPWRGPSSSAVLA